MSDPNENPDKDRAQGNQDPASPPSGVGVDDASKGSVEAPKPTQSASQTQKETLDAIRKGERIALIIAAIVAFGTIGQWITSCNNNASTTKQTERLLDAANRVDDAAESFSRSASGINGGVNNAVDKLNLQADALNKSVAQASRLATDTETANTNALESDRPWLGGYISVTGFEAGKSPEAVCAFQNAGRRPALVEHQDCRIDVDSKIVIPTPNPAAPPPPKAILIPGLTISIHQIFFWAGSSNYFRDNKLTTAFMDEFNSGRAHLRVISTVVYRDIRSGKEYHTFQCVRYRPASYASPATFDDCDTDNDAN